MRIPSCKPGGKTKKITETKVPTPTERKPKAVPTPPKPKAVLPDPAPGFTELLLRIDRIRTGLNSLEEGLLAENVRIEERELDMKESMKEMDVFKSMMRKFTTES